MYPLQENINKMLQPKTMHLQKFGKSNSVDNY
jgi:hypothetical protein